MRVLLTTNIDNRRHPPVTALRYLVRELPDVSFHAFSHGGGTADDAIWSRPNLTRVTPPQALLVRYDIIHMKTASRAALLLVGAYGALRRRIARTVFTASIEPSPTDGTFTQMRRAVRTTDYLTAISEATSRGLLTHFGRAAAAVTPNGVDTTFFAPSEDGLTGAGRRNVVGVVGYLSMRKRFDFVLELAAGLSDVTFLVAGQAYTPDEQRRAEHAMRSLPNVTYVGHVSKPELRDLLDRCRLLAFPSAREGSPSAVLEALSMGVPVLAQPVSSLPEYVSEGLNGWLRECSVEPWSEVIRMAVQMPDDAYARIAGRARERAIRRHAWSDAAQRYRDAYGAALDL